MLYQAKHSNLCGSLSSSSWDFMTPSTELLRKQKTLDELQSQVTSINDVAARAFKKELIPITKKIVIGIIIVLLLSVVLLSKEKIQSGMAAVWCIFAMLSGCMYFMNSVYKSNKIAIEAVRDHIKYHINPSYPLNTEIEWEFKKETVQYRLPPIDYYHIIIKCNDQKPKDISIKMNTIPNQIEKKDEEINSKKNLNWAEHVGCQRKSWIHPDNKTKNQENMHHLYAIKE